MRICLQKAQVHKHIQQYVALFVTCISIKQHVSYMINSSRVSHFVLQAFGHIDLCVCQDERISERGLLKLGSSMIQVTLGYGLNRTTCAKYYRWGIDALRGGGMKEY